MTAADSYLPPPQSAPSPDLSRMRYTYFIATLALVAASQSHLDAQGPSGRAPDTSSTLITPARVFDGMDMHDGWSVLVRGDRIAAAGPSNTIAAPANATRVGLPGATLMPGMIEMHSHLLLHPYNETTWDDQVQRERLAKHLVVPRRLVVRMQEEM